MNIQHRIHIIKVSDDEVFYFVINQNPEYLFCIAIAFKINEIK